MKKALLISVSVLLLALGCSTDKKDHLEGRWELVAELADPGDGSGTFQPTNREKYLEFTSAREVVSNVSHCMFSENADSGKSGSYSLEESVLIFTCDSGEESYSFQLINDELILNFPRCIEPCQEKYKRVR